MHRALNIKHRIVRRVDVGKAPLATFDTVDLGDEDVKPKVKTDIKFTVSADNRAPQYLNSIKPKEFISDGGLKTETIGGNNSKKSLSHAGGEEKEVKDADRTKDRSGGGGEVGNVADTNQSSSVVVESQAPETQISETVPQNTETVAPVKASEIVKETGKELGSSHLTRQGTIGRVSIPIRKQDSDSSSSSASNEANFTFEAHRPSVGHLESTDTYGHCEDTEAERDFHHSLVPDNIDPSQILSPSKRKAYERRIERLKVTTSPIARPRSTAPISVVTLNEYANISSPEASPASPSAIPDKLKITLPTDEFTAKPKTPKTSGGKRRDSEDTCFEFTEEILFSRTKSALVVNEDGHLPISPRRVLIPPTITPTSSPKLSPVPRFSSDSLHEETAAPKLVYIQHNETARKFFGDTVDEPEEEEGWAKFPDTSENAVCESGSFSVNDKKSEENQPTETAGDSFVAEVDHKITASSSVETLTEEVAPSDSISKPTSDPCAQVCDLESEKLPDSEARSDLVKIHVERDDNVESANILLKNVEQSVCTTGGSEDTYIAKKNEASSAECSHEYDSEEEVLTVEINQSDSGCEKHIEIDIKSSGSSSGSLSSPSSEIPHIVQNLDSEQISSIPNDLTEPQPELVQMTDTVKQDNTTPVPSSNISSTDSDTLQTSTDEQPATADYLCGSHQEDKNSGNNQQPLDLQKICSTSIAVSDTRCPQTDSLVSSSEQGEEVSVPQPYFPQVTTASTSDGLTSFITQQSFHTPPQQQEQQEHLHQLPDVGLGLPHHQPTTNPFLIGFEPPASDPFDLGVQQVNTNPFLGEQSQHSGSSDLIDFSSSLDNSST